MINYNSMLKRSQASVMAALFGLALLMPVALMLPGRAAAYAQLSERSIAISTSVASATNVEYAVSFKTATTSDVQAIIIDFCDGPIVGTVCVPVTGLNVNKGSTTINNLVGIADTWTVDTTVSSDTKLMIKNTSGGSIASGTTVSFKLGNGTSNGITNPSTTGSFYARILTFATETPAISYNSGSVGAANPPAATVDAGGVALSTANQLTINARVQEILQFCVGTTDAGTASDCTDISGTVVDLGVIGSGVVSVSPVDPQNGGNNRNGLAMIRTNAVGGANIKYFASPVGGGSNLLGSLRVTGATCGTNTTLTDQCFNSPTSKTEFVINTEAFGMTATLDTSNGDTTNLVRDAAYAGDGSAGEGFAWTGTTPATIASSPTVIDDEMLVLRFAAVAGVTTPTGQYGVRSTYIATSTF
jgi:hypothetical protein